MLAKRHISPKTKACRTVAEVIIALDGGGNVARLTGRKAQHISNWKNDSGRFPKDTFLVMQAALKAKGYSAPPALWGITEP